MQTENFPNGDYILSVTGGDNFEFAGEAKLGYLVKNFSVFIQTDKALYKADDLMRFRLFAVDANTLPYEVKASPVVSIFNPSNILVKKYSNVTFLKGRYEGEFQLASDPLVGGLENPDGVRGSSMLNKFSFQRFKKCNFFRFLRKRSL